jgi:YidC/Oxa1 family membrane protein insertase
MNIFDLIIVQPIFNFLLFIYNFVGDYGVAIIILTIIIRFALWPLVRKQMRQTKLMRAVQPELKKIKKQAKGDRMVESQLTMDLYKKKGVKPFSSILVLLVQLPIFIAVFTVIRNYEGFLESFVYPFLVDFGNIPNLMASPETPHLFGIDLTGTVINDVAANWPILLMAILAAGLQFFQSKQTMPTTENKKKLREYFKDAAAGKEVDQAEMSQNMTRNMMYMFPILTFAIAISLPGAVVLYFVTQSAVAVAQQQFMLKRGEKETEEITDEQKPGKKRADKAQEAVIVEKRSSKSIQPDKKKSGDGNTKTVVRRIKAK